MPKKSYLCNRIRKLRIGAGVKFQDGVFTTDLVVLQKQIESSDLFGVHVFAVPTDEVDPPKDDDEIDFFPTSTSDDGPEPVADPAPESVDPEEDAEVADEEPSVFPDPDWPQDEPADKEPWYKSLTATAIVTMKVADLKALATELAIDIEGMKTAELRRECRFKLEI